MDVSDEKMNYCSLSQLNDFPPFIGFSKPDYFIVMKALPPSILCFSLVAHHMHQHRNNNLRFETFKNTFAQLPYPVNVRRIQ
jgi:hypothetical protein